MASILEGMPCRIEHKKWIPPSANTNGHWGESEYEYGTFLDFSTDHEEYENGPGLYPVAIVMLETGQLASVHINNIQILEPEEQSDDGHNQTMGNTQNPDDPVNV